MPLQAFIDMALGGVFYWFNCIAVILIWVNSFTNYLQFKYVFFMNVS